MRIRRLRDRLIVLSAGLVLLVTLATLLFVRATTLEALQTELRSSLANAPGPFESSQQQVGEVLFGQADQVREDPVFQQIRVEYLGKRDGAPGTDRAQEAEDALRSLREEIGALVHDPEMRIADLLVLTTLDGKLLVEHVEGAATQDGVPVTPVLEGPLAQAVLEEGDSFVTHTLYRDQIYLVAALPLLRGDYVDGALLLGRRLDGQEASEAARTVPRSVVAFVAGGKVLAAAGAQGPADADEIQAWLQGWTPPKADRSSDDRPDLVEARFRTGTELIQPHPIWSEFEEAPIAWALFAKDLGAIERMVGQQARALLGFGAVGVLLALLMSTRLSGALSRPIERLAGLMRRVGEGDLDVEAPPGGAVEVAQLAESFNSMTTGLRQKHVLEKYVPLGARKEIEQNLEGRIELGGKRVKATILFSDLRGFTSMSEALEPQEVVSVLNEYLERMTRTILTNFGDVNEYIGDAILAVFHEPEGAHRATLAALLMQDQLELLRQKRAGTILATLRMGIGIHTGEVVEGNIGTAERVKFSVVGDTVNLAARIQDRSRDGRFSCILLSEATASELGDAFVLETFGDIQFKGRRVETRVFEVVGLPPRTEEALPVGEI